MHQPDDTDLFEKVKKSDLKAFEILFQRYYRHLCLFSSTIVKDNIEAEEIVQDFFVKLWEKREQITIETSVKNYVFRSVKNLCINYVQHHIVKQKYAKHVLSESETEITEDTVFTEIDLAEKIAEGINSLPEKRREIFRLSREEGLKYREIAEKLQISVKTVEVHMGLAIKTLKEKLKKYNTFFTLFLCFFQK